MRGGKLLVFCSMGIVAFLGWTSVFGDRGLLRIRELRAQEVSLRSKADGMESENARLRENVRRLNEDDRYLERVARESQGLVKDGEVVYLFPSDP